MPGPPASVTKPELNAEYVAYAIGRARFVRALNPGDRELLEKMRETQGGAAPMSPRPACHY